jgi:hypothetical protein
VVRISARFDYAQELRVGIGVDVSVSFLVEELAEVFGVDEVTVDAHGDTERGVDVEGLSFRAAVAFLVSGVRDCVPSNTYAEAVPMVG